MERRDFLKIFSVGTVAAMSGQLVHRSAIAPEIVPYEDIDASVRELANSIEFMSTPAPRSGEFLSAFRNTLQDPIVNLIGNSANFPDDHPVQATFQPNGLPADAILATTSSPDRGQYLSKMSDYENAHRGDTYLERARYPVLISSFKRLDRVQNLVGHGNFNVISFDETLKYGERYSSVGQFSPDEKSFLEELFFANARQYGFLGEKVITDLTAPIPEPKRLKVSKTGHFLYRGDSQNLYMQLKKDLGDSIVLTSGIRSVVKQTHLFLAKTIQSKGNLSKASRSLAPPGHSYHGIGDFDVGKVGFGRKNFTEAFAATDEFRKLVDLGYVDIRYPKDNLFGVRYEPWHIKVV